MHSIPMYVPKHLYLLEQHSDSSSQQLYWIYTERVDEREMIMQTISPMASRHVTHDHTINLHAHA